MEKVIKTNNCWKWNGCVLKNGYGQIKGESKIVYAHRAAYEIFIEPIPFGMQIDHLCKNKKCVNPKHLEVVTPAINTQRGPLVKLNSSMIKKIRALKGKFRVMEIACIYPLISHQHISRILNNKTWKV